MVVQKKNEDMRKTKATPSPPITEMINPTMLEYVRGKILVKILEKDKITNKAFKILKTLGQGLDWYR